MSVATKCFSRSLRRRRVTLEHESEENKDGGDNVVYDDDDNEGGVLGDEAVMSITQEVVGAKEAERRP